MNVYVINFFFTKKKKLQKEVGELGQLNRLCRLLAFSGDEFVKIEPRVRLSAFAHSST